MATIKITKRDNFMALSALVENSTVTNKAQLLDFIAHEVELLDRKASKASGTVSKTTQENEGIKARILSALATAEKALTITEFQSAFPEFADYSNQKMSALFSQLKKEGKVEKTIDKKKSYFSLVEVEDTDEGEGEE